jgi:hypothetical protein
VVDDVLHGDGGGGGRVVLEPIKMVINVHESTKFWSDSTKSVGRQKSKSSNFCRPT